MLYNVVGLLKMMAFLPSTLKEKKTVCKQMPK